MPSNKTLRATHGSADRPLKIGDLEIPCYVLENGTRVLSGRGVQTALGLGQRHGALLKGFLSRNNLIPYINNKLAMALSEPIRFIRPGRGGKLAVGHEATVLVDICDAVLLARKDGVLKGKQLFIAEQCESLTRAFAKVGIIALVDEATGYQEIRDRRALQAILEKVLTEEKLKWAKTFPDEFYKQIFKLKGWAYPTPGGRRPGVVGHYTNDIVYKRLHPGVMKKLRELNPTTESGRRKDKHFQFFTEDYGSPELKDHIKNLIFLMSASPDWDTFKKLLKRAAPKMGDTIEMFEDDKKIKID